MGEMSKVEEVARAIAEKYHGREVTSEYLFGEATGGLVFVECAKAAIKAMQCPTEAMVEAGAVVDDDFSEAAPVRACWMIYHAMIDEALKE